MMPWMMVKALIIVVAVTLLMTYAVYKGYLDGATVEIGDHYYAERVHVSMKGLLPRWIKMPFNSVVNIGYVIVGAAWCAATTIALSDDRIRKSDAQFLYIFNLASCCYGPIQTLRILTQLKGFAILDQWYTLPFFMLVFIWGINVGSQRSTIRNILFMIASIGSYFLSSCHTLGFEINLGVHICLAVTGAIFVWMKVPQAKCKTSFICALLLGNILFMIASIGSYFLSSCHRLGFEINLGVHICLAVTGAIFAWMKVPQAKCKTSFICALLSCSGFVVLKLFDLELIKYFDIFKYISGHFISKVCDIFQVHFVNYFCFTIASASYADSKKKKE